MPNPVCQWLSQNTWQQMSRKAAQQAHQYNFINMHVGRAEKEPRAGVGIEEWTSERQKEKI